MEVVGVGVWYCSVLVIEKVGSRELEQGEGKG
jgi:hypothetical protein